MSALVCGLDVHKDNTYATILSPEGKIVNFGGRVLLLLHPKYPSDAPAVIGYLKLTRQIGFILHIPLISLQEAVFTVKSWSKVLFVEIQVAKNSL